MAVTALNSGGWKDIYETTIASDLCLVRPSGLSHQGDLLHFDVRQTSLKFARNAQGAFYPWVLTICWTLLLNLILCLYPQALLVNLKLYFIHFIVLTYCQIRFYAFI